MISIGQTFKELLEKHSGESFSVSGGSGAVILDFPNNSYVIDSRGISLELQKEHSSVVAPALEIPAQMTLEKPKLPFTKEDFPALEQALMRVHRIYLDPSVKVSDQYDLWDIDEKNTNYLPLGMMEGAPGHLPYGWTGDDTDYIKFGVDDENRLYADVSFIPLGPVDHLSSFEEDLKNILDNTRLGEILSLDEFKSAIEEEDDWTLNHFSRTEIYDLTFEIVEEKDSHEVTASVGYPLRGIRFPMEYDGKYYSIYVHEHED